MNRVLITVILCLGLLVGCGGSGSDIVPIGVILPLTGPYAQYGDSVKKGLELALDHKVRPYPETRSRFLVHYVDSEGLERIGVDGAREMVEQHVPMVIGPVMSSVAMAVAPMLNRSETVMLSPTASTPDLPKLGPFIFRNTPSDLYEGVALATVADKRGYRDIALLTIDSAYGDGLGKVIGERIERAGGEIVLRRSFTPGALEFEELVTAAMASEPDAVILISYAPEFRRILGAMRAKEWDVPVLSSGSVALESFLADGADLLEGVILTQPAYDPHSRDENVGQFVESFEKKYGTTPDVFAAHAYDAMVIAVSTIEVAGANPKAIRDALFVVRKFPGVSGVTNMNSIGDCEKPSRICVVHDGRLVAFSY